MKNGQIRKAEPPLEHARQSSERIRVLSLMWGLAGGGISHYVASLHKLNQYADVEFSHVIIRMEDWPIHPGLWNTLNPSDIIIKNRLDLSWLPKFKALVNDLNPDLLAFHGFNGFIVSGLTQLTGLRTPVIATYHGAYFPSSNFRRMVAPIVNAYTFKFMRDRAKRVVVVSEKERNFLIENRVPKEKIEIIYNGIDQKPLAEPHSSQELKPLALSPDAVIIGATSSFHPIKGLLYLLQGFAQVCGKRPQAHLLLFGKGPLEEELRQLARELNIADNVHFMGFRSDVQRWLSLFDIFVIPSLYEAHSIGLLEAMRSGRAIVCTDVGGNRESIRNNIDGLTIPSQDSVALSEALSKLIDDPDLRLSFGQSAKIRFQEHFTETKMLHKTLTTLRSALNYQDSTSGHHNHRQT